jgi:hypothetical protein
MTENTYNLIIKTIKSGKKIAVKDLYLGNWKVFLYIMPDGNLQATYYGDTVKESLKAGLSDEEWDKYELLKHFTDEYIIDDLGLNPAPLMLKEGDKVQILENCMVLILEGWESEAIEMIGKKGFEIREFYDLNYGIYTKDKSGWFAFPHWAVALMPEEEEVETVMTVAEIEAKLGLKNLKIVK